jgi:sterol desaturase/sphingolipid hydroxylase (fatty acid hydroxylase superfamily)
MSFFNELYKEVLSFFRIDNLLKTYSEKGIDALFTYEGITSIFICSIPIILIYEISRSVFILKKGTRFFNMSIFIYIVNRIINRTLGLATAAFCIAFFKPHALFQTSLTWYWFIYCYIVWEFSHFIYHYFAHKVRLLWCLHSSHHIPEDMNLSVNFSHIFLEAVYADFVRVSICMLLGVNLPFLFMIMTLDWIWGELIHLSEDTLKNARLGFLGKLILTPSHHRVHHARNLQYMDKNYCNLLNIWDRLFKTYEEEVPEVKPEYGITRPVNSNNFFDVYFSEITALAKDVYHAPGIINKIKYLLKPPGWSHTGNHKTIAALREHAALASQK